MLDATDDVDKGGGGGDKEGEEDGGRDGEEEDTICGCLGDCDCDCNCDCPGGCDCDCPGGCDCDCGEEGGRDGEEDIEDKEEEDCVGVVLGWFDRADSLASLDDRFVRKVEEESTSEEKKVKPHRPSR